MKKVFLTLFAAILISTAHAASMMWSEVGGTLPDNKPIIAGTGFVPVSFSIAVHLEAEVSAEAELAKMGYWNGDAFLKVNTSEEFFYRAGNTDAGWSPGTTALTTGQTHVITFNLTPKEGTSDANIVIYVDGTQYASFTEGNGKTGLSLWVYDNDAWNVTEVAAYDGLLTTEQMNWLVENDHAVLPEPTVLALLALGVAGVALRRRSVA